MMRPLTNNFHKHSICLLCCLWFINSADAQFNTSITDTMYERPWQLHGKIIDKMSDEQLKQLHNSNDLTFNNTLFYLKTDANYFEKQVLDTLHMLLEVAEFAEISGQISRDWGETLGRVQNNLMIVYEHLGLESDVLVKEADEATTELVDALSRQRPFEKDVLNSVGAGIRQRVVGMANRWWNSSQGLKNLINRLWGERPQEDL